MNDIATNLIAELFKTSMSRNKGLNAPKFRANHHEHLDLLDQLEYDGYIEKRAENYYVKFRTIIELLQDLPEAKKLLWLCSQIFRILRASYKKHQTMQVDLNNLAEEVDVPRRDINIALQYMVEVPIWAGYSAEFYAMEDAHICPDESILRYNTFKEAVENMLSWQKTKVLKNQTVGQYSEDDKEEITDFRFLLHPAIIEHSLGQFENGYMREAVLNSIMAIYDLVRSKTGLTQDGDKLIGKAFSTSDPFLIFSDLDTESGRNDQAGFMQILKGANQGIRNIKAHSLTHDLTPEKTAQYLVFASLLARRIDEAEVVKKITG